jgi:hypothetical protein
MIKTRIGLTILLGVFLLGCTTPNSAMASCDRTPISEQVSSENRGQTLPIGAKAKMGEETIELEVAKTPQQQEMGLMYRSSLPKNRGMLFLFESPRYARFWMKNTIIPLDIVFLKDGEIKAIFANVPPCTREPCQTYGPAIEIDRVIELAGGRAQELDLKVGDRVTIEFFSDP